MRTTTSALAALLGGRLSGPDVEVDGMAADSRALSPGQLFVPLQGKRDGHDFIDAALAAGASAYLTSRPLRAGTAVVVDDVTKAVDAMAVWARSRLPDRVVGITGSVGKTSTKDLAASVLARRWATAASPRSYNNEIGVPLTLVNAAEGTEAAVVEMGARGRGHIRALCRLARPTVGVVTSVGVCHTEQFGSLDVVAESKGELVESLPAEGTAVLNADDDRVRAMASRTVARVLAFGEAGEVRAAEVRLDDELRPSFRLETPWGAVPVALQARGEHQVGNALSASAAALACGVGLEEVAAGLAVARLSPWRMELLRTSSGAVVLNDSYNANPASTRAALRALASLGARRRTAVLGVMAELGSYSSDEHRRVGELAADLGIRVISVSAPEYGGEDVEGPEAALDRVGPLTADDAVLVKGSRAAGLEGLAASLAAS